MSSKNKSKNSLNPKSQKKIDASPFEQWPSRPTSAKLPFGSFTKKIIIVNGEIVERVYESPNGEVTSLFPNHPIEVAA